MNHTKFSLFCGIILAASVARSECANDLSALKAVVGQDKCPPLSWVESSADDNKPMVIKLSGNPLKIVISKGGKVWMHSKLQICKEDGKLLLKFTEQPTIVNDDVLPLANSAMKNGASLPVTMDLQKMTLRANMFWTGRFIKNEQPKDECE